MYAAKKEANEFFLYSGMNLNATDLNQLNNDNNQLRELTYWDKMRLKAKHYEIKGYQLFFQAITSDKPKDIYEMLKSKFTGKKENLEEGIIIWHEKYVSGSDFGQHNKQSKKWH